MDRRAVECLTTWHASLERYQHGLPARGSVTAALIVLQRLQESYDLSIASHVADGGSQIAGLSADAVSRILSRFGEARVLSKTGGRSNRGARGDIERLLERIAGLQLEGLDPPARNAVLQEMQGFVVDNFIRAYFDLRRIKAVFDPNATTRQLIRRILDEAATRGQTGIVAQHLVGAKLSLTFGRGAVANESVSAGDDQTNRRGDFELGNTVFHVTVSPLPALLEKCSAALEQGYRVYLLVDDDNLAGARQNVELVCAGRIAVESIESFVSTNVDELSEFLTAKLAPGFRSLLEEYNRRVDEVESDKSLLIDLPDNVC